MTDAHAEGKGVPADPAVNTGYTLLRVYALEQKYIVRPGTDYPADRRYNLGWEWQPSGPRTFDVAFSIRIDPSAQQQDEASVTTVGTFQAGADPLPVSFPDFVQYSAPVILLPFAREMLADLTRRGPYGVFLLMPLNIQTLMRAMDLSQTAGARALRENEELAQLFQLTLSNSPTRERLETGRHR